MYQGGRGGLPKDDNKAIEWYRKAAEQGDANGKALLTAIEERRRGLSDLSRTVAELVKANDKDSSAAPTADAERIRLAREVIDASGVRATLANSPDELNERFTSQRADAKMPPKMLDAIRVTAISTFTPDRILASLERRLAETLDVGTLQVGLQWERSDVARHMQRLELEASKREQLAAKTEFARQLVAKGGRTDEPRARACAQADTLADQTDAVLPFLEAFTAGVMIGNAQQAPAPDIDAIRRSVVSARPMLREIAREGVLAECLFQYRGLSDGEVEQWLGFLRSDSGGQYARGLNQALRNALLDAAEVFTRTLLDVARQLKQRGSA